MIIYFNPLFKINKYFIFSGKFIYSLNLIILLFSFFKSLYQFFLKKKVYFINPLFIFKQCIYNGMPFLKLENKSISGKVQKIPTILEKNDSIILFFQWFKFLFLKSNHLKFKMFKDIFCIEFIFLYFWKSKLFNYKKDYYLLVLKHRSLLRFLK